MKRADEAPHPAPERQGDQNDHGVELEPAAEDERSDEIVFDDVQIVRYASGGRAATRRAGNVTMATAATDRMPAAAPI